jgi:site-specific recombinase XerC
VRPFEQFIEQALKDYERHLRHEGLKQEALRERMTSAREFAVFLVGRPLSKTPERKSD